MPNVWTVQSNLSQGELDPKLIGRIDLAVYYNGLRRARDVTPLAQGGMSRRNGVEFIEEIDGGGQPATRIFAFENSAGTQYLLAFSQLRMHIYKDGVSLQANINGSGNDFLTTTFTFEINNEMDIIQSEDTIIITHDSIAPVSIISTADTTWAQATIALTNVPQFDYNDASSPTPTSEVQSVVFANQNTSDRYKLGLEGILTDEIIFAASMATNAELIQTALQDLPNTANSGVTVAAVSITTYTVTFADASAKDWELITGTAVVSQVATFTVTTTETTPGVARTEDVWSATRGWPVSCSFHEDRLFFGGSTQRPQTLWGSVVGDFFNFNRGRARANEGIDVTLATDQNNAIRRIFSNTALQIFTRGQEFFIPQSPITPDGVAATSQSNFGSKLVRPITIDGRTLYLQRTGKAVREFIQSSDVAGVYNSNSITLLVPHLLDDPSRIAASRGDINVDANYAYVVNSDGTLLVYNSLSSEGLSGFTLWSIPEFDFRDVAIVNDEVFVLTQQAGTFTAICRMSANHVTDMGLRENTPGSGIFTGLDHLDGETVQIVGDGAFEGTAVVASGQVTVDATKTITEVGLGFFPVIETMPLNQAMQNGPNFAEPKFVGQITIDFFESLGIKVSNAAGQTARIADKTMAVDVFDNPTPHTGRESVWLLGWDDLATITITQDTPVPMTILTIAAKVGVQ